MDGHGRMGERDFQVKNGIKIMLNVKSALLSPMMNIWQGSYVNSFAALHKKILIIAAIAFGLLAACYLMKRWWFEATPIDQYENHVCQALKELSLLSDAGSDRFGVYITANDFGFENTSKKIAGLCSNNGIHIGCAGWHNFDIMSKRHSQFGIIADYGKSNKNYIELTRDIILLSANRKGFVERMIESIKSVPFRIGEDVLDRLPEERIKDQLQDKNSWLGNDESFEYIKGLFQMGKIIAITIDFTKEETSLQMKNLLKKNDFTVDTLYLCNIRYFIKEDHQHDFAKALNALIDDETLIIHCPHVLAYQEEANLKKLPVKFQENSLKQSVIHGKELKKNPAAYFIRHSSSDKDKNQLV